MLIAVAVAHPSVGGVKPRHTMVVKNIIHLWSWFGVMHPIIVWHTRDKSRDKLRHIRVWVHHHTCWKQHVCLQ